jgi:hypothetical protein
MEEFAATNEAAGSEEAAPTEEVAEQAVEEVANAGEEVVESEPTEDQPQGPDKLKANERIQQEIGRRKAEEERARQLEQRLNQLESQFTAQKQPEYIEITPQVQQQINTALAQIEQQRAEAELEGDYLKAAQYRKQFDQILQGLQENERIREQALATQQQRQQEEAKVRAINERAEFFRQTNNIPPEQWQAANDWFAAEVNKNPALGVQFREIADYSGPMAAVDFAVRYVQQNMQRPIEEATQQKIAQKTQLPGGTAQNTGQVLNQVKELKAKALQSGSSDAWADYFAAKSKLGKS